MSQNTVTNMRLQLRRTRQGLVRYSALIVFILVGLSVQGHKNDMVKVASMRDNGTTDEWRFTVKPDTTHLEVDSLIRSGKDVIGYRLQDGEVVLLHEKPKPVLVPENNKMPNTFGRITDNNVLYADSTGVSSTGILTWTSNIHRVHHTKKKKTVHKKRTHYITTTVSRGHSEYETVTYFKGTGVVDERYGDIIFLSGAKGTFYKRRVKVWLTE